MALTNLKQQPPKTDNTTAVVAGVSLGATLLAGLAAAFGGGGSRKPVQGRFGRRPAKSCNTPCGR